MAGRLCIFAVVLLVSAFFLWRGKLKTSEIASDADRRPVASERDSALSVPKLSRQSSQNVSSRPVGDPFEFDSGARTVGLVGVGFQTHEVSDRGDRALRERLRSEDIANGVNSALWKQEERLRVAAKQIRAGTPMDEAVRILGNPTDVIIPPNRSIRLEEIAMLKPQRVQLLYSPAGRRDYYDTDYFEVLAIVLNRDLAVENAFWGIPIGAKQAPISTATLRRLGIAPSNP